MKPPLVMSYRPDRLPAELNFEYWLWPDIVKALSKADIWHLDTETYPNDWSDYDARMEYSKLVKKVSGTNYQKYYQRERKRRSLDPKLNTIRLLQIYIKDYIFILDTDCDDIIDILDMLPNKMVSGTNIKFDLMTIYKYSRKRLVPKAIYDILIGHQILMYQKNPKKEFKIGYKDLVKRFCNVDLSKEEQTAEWDLDLTSNMIYYAYHDVLYLPKIISAQVKGVNKNSAHSIITPYFKIVHDAVLKLEMEFIKVVIDMELEGIPVNVKGLKEFKAKFQHELQKSYDNLKGLNANSSKQIVSHLKKYGVDTTKTDANGGVKNSGDKSTLLRNLNTPLVHEILTNRMLRKLDGDIDKYAENPVAYSHYNSIVGFTGRMSAKDIPVQTIPRKIKNVFYKPSDDNWVIIKADYPNIEARIVSVIANDARIQKIFKCDEDMHIETAKNVLGVQKVTKEERQKAKAVNFGLIYGAGAKTFQAYAFDVMGLKITIEKAKEYRMKFLETYEGVYKFHMQNSDKIREYGKFIQKSLYGRRMMVSRFTDANNFPVQGSGADIIKLAAFNIWAKLDFDKARIINIIHDEIVIKTKPDYKDTATKILKEGMENAVNKLITAFTTKVDVEVVE